MPQWQRLAAGDVIPDYGGKDETFTVESIAPPYSLVYRSRRGRVDPPEARAPRHPAAPTAADHTGDVHTREGSRGRGRSGENALVTSCATAPTGGHPGRRDEPTAGPVSRGRPDSVGAG